MDILAQEAAKYGIGALMFVVLFIYTLKQNQIREAKYQTIIEVLSNKLPEILDDIKSIMVDLNIIKNKVSKE